MFNGLACSAIVFSSLNTGWFIMSHYGFLIIISLTVLINCKKKGKNNGPTTKSKTSKTLAGATATGTASNVVGDTPIPVQNKQEEKPAKPESVYIDPAEKKKGSSPTGSDTKTADNEVDKGKEKEKEKKKKAKNKKTQESQDADEAKKTEEPMGPFETTLRIEMVDDDNTRTKTTDASACFDAYENEKEEVKLEKKQSVVKEKGKKKKKKDTTVQSVDCAEAAEKDKKDKKQKSKKSKKSMKSMKSAKEKGPQKSTKDKVQQKSAPAGDDDKVHTMVEGGEEGAK